MCALNIQVSPYLLPGDVVASLQGLASPNLVQVSGNAPATLPAAPSMEFHSNFIDVTAAINLGFGGLASIQGSGAVSYFLADFTANCPPVPGRSGSLISQEYYGAGFRVCVKAWNLDTSLSTNLFGVAAQCTVKTASSCYEIAFFGIDLSLLGSVAPFLGGISGSFDASAIERLGSMMSATATAVLSGKTKPVLLAVDIDPSNVELPLAKAYSTSYALQSIWNHNLSLNDALSKLASVPNRANVDRAVVQAVYGAFLNNAAANAQPSSVPGAQAAAKAAQFWGE